MSITRFSQKVCEKLGYYVYIYIDPRNNRPFYVGKGRGNRVFSHLREITDSRKVKTINDIKKKHDGPEIEILVHKLADQAAALRIEAAVIDLLGLDQLTNKIRGQWGDSVGRMNLKAVNSRYGGKHITIDEPSLLIRINQLYRPGMTPRALYEATRGVWRLGDRCNKAKYAFAVYKGMVKEVYEILKWHDAGTLTYRTRTKEDVEIQGRREFSAKLAGTAMRKRYIDESVAHLLPDNGRFPVRYVKCDPN